MANPFAAERGSGPDKRSHNDMIACDSTKDTCNSDRQNKRPRNHFSQSGIVTTLVGQEEDQEDFEVHKEFLCKYSGFFLGCLRTDFAESHSNKILLLEDEPFSVRLFIDWMSNSNIELTEITAEAHISAVYSFADKICAK